VPDTTSDLPKTSTATSKKKKVSWGFFSGGGIGGLRVSKRWRAQPRCTIIILLSRLEAEKVNLITMFPTFRMIAKLVQRGKDRERESPKEKRDGEVKQRKIQLKMVLRVRGETSKPKLFLNRISPFQARASFP